MEFFAKKVKTLMVGALLLLLFFSAQPSVSTRNTSHFGNVGLTTSYNEENNPKGDSPLSSPASSTVSRSFSTATTKTTLQKSQFHYLPSDLDTWRSIRKSNKIYVDKTRFLFPLRDVLSAFVLFRRPRKFGNTFFIETMESYFKGEKVLFEGTSIFPFGNCKNGTWIEYPVIRLDINAMIFSKDYCESEKLPDLTRYLEEQFNSLLNQSIYEYNLEESLDTEKILWFPSIIESLYLKFRLPVVILIDEYDNMIIKAMHMCKNHDAADRISNFFDGKLQNIKAHSRSIKFAWVTGVNQLVINSLSSFADITYENEFAAVVGFTKNEIQNYFKTFIDDFAAYSNNSSEEIMTALTYWYGGYKFGLKEWEGKQNSQIYNPMSVINCLKNQRFEQYWSESGNIKFIVKYIFGFKFRWDKEFEISWRDALSKSSYGSLPVWRILLKNGYFTFRNYTRNRRSKISIDEDDEFYKLAVPNNEIRRYLTEKLESYVPDFDIFIEEATEDLDSLSKKIRNPKNFAEAVAILNKLGFFDVTQSFHFIENGQYNATRRICLFFHHAGIRYDQPSLVSREDGKIGADIDILTRNLSVNYAIKIEYGNPKKAVDQILGYFFNHYEIFHNAVQNETKVYITAINFLKRRDYSTEISHWIVIPCNGSVLLLDEMEASSEEMKDYVRDFIKDGHFL